MKISEAAADTVLDIKEFSANKLKNESDISLLIEASTGREKLLNDTAFTAKYLNGLGKILHSGGTVHSPKGEVNEEAKEKVKAEFKQAMMKLTLQLSEIIKDIPADDKKSFGDKYLAMNRTALVNLTSLIYDLSWVKKYLNSKR